MMQIEGIARTPLVTLTAELTFPGILTTPARIERVEKFAGSSVGSAVVSFPLMPAQRALIGYGKAAKITVGGQPIFRGTVGTAPICVSGDRDSVECVLYDDKWGMQRMIVGQRGIGSRSGDAKGFTDVGFEIIFNRDGRPNKDHGALDFNTGSTAVLWTLKDVVKFLFQWFIDPEICTLDASVLDAAFDRKPSHLALVGQDGAAAVDTVCKVAGRSWGLKAGDDASSFVIVKPGGNTQRTIYFFNPMSGRVVTEAGEWHAGEATIQGSILHARDVHQVKSARIVKETTLKSYGPNPALDIIDYPGTRFAKRVAMDVTKYEANGLGKNLSAGSPRKPWLSNLVTRIDENFVELDDIYVEAADVLNNLDAPRAEICVWVAADARDENLRAVHGGYEIDYEHALIDFGEELNFIGADGKTEKVEIDWDMAEVVITVATLLEDPQFEESDAGSTYLPKRFAVMIDKPDLVPERRQNCRLPDLSSIDPDAVVTVAVGAEEKYYDVTDRLREAADASLASMPKVETPISVELPLFPLCEIGDSLKINGRDLGATGDEVIISIRYAIAEQFRTSVEATNVTAAIEPERFIKR